MTVSKAIFRLLKLPPRLLYAVGLGRIYGRLVLLLTTTGRRTGKPRVTPLQYEKVNGSLVVASVHGARADWVRNALADPHVGARNVVVDIADRALYVAKRHGPNMWAGIFGTEHTEETPVEDLLVMIMERPELLGAEGSIRLVTSRPTPARSELRAGSSKRRRVS